MRAGSPAKSGCPSVLPVRAISVSCSLVKIRLSFCLLLLSCLLLVPSPPFLALSLSRCMRSSSPFPSLSALRLYLTSVSPVILPAHFAVFSASSLHSESLSSAQPFMCRRQRDSQLRASSHSRCLFLSLTLFSSSHFLPLSPSLSLHAFRHSYSHTLTLSRKKRKEMQAKRQ